MKKYTITELCSKIIPKIDGKKQYNQSMESFKKIIILLDINKNIQNEFMSFIKNTIIDDITKNAVIGIVLSIIIKYIHIDYYNLDFVISMIMDNSHLTFYSSRQWRGQRLNINIEDISLELINGELLRQNGLYNF